MSGNPSMWTTKTTILRVGNAIFQIGFLFLMYVAIIHLWHEHTTTNFSYEEKPSFFPAFTICPKGYFDNTGYYRQLGKDLNTTFMFEFMGNVLDETIPEWLELFVEKHDDKTRY